MGFYEDRVLPRVIDKLLGNEAMEQVRRPALVGLHGEVLEVGFGSGPNVALYPPEVTKVFAVDPAVVGRRLAADRVAASPIPIEYVGLDGAALPLGDDTVDCVLSTWTLCTIPDLDAALAEMRRVLRPRGQLHFLEHGLSEDPKIAHRQHRLNPIQNKIAGGCHLDRDIDQLIRGAGFEIDRLKRFSISGPKTMSSMYCGVAVSPAT